MKNMNWVVVRDINSASAYPIGEKHRDPRPQVAEFTAWLKPRRIPGALIGKEVRYLKSINSKFATLPRKTLSQALGEIRAIKGMKLPFKFQKISHETPENHLAI